MVLHLLLHSSNSAAAAAAVAAPSCPVVGGVVDASKCEGGFQAANSTLALRAAFSSGAQQVNIPNMGSAWFIASIPGVDSHTGSGANCPLSVHAWGHCPSIYLFNISDLIIVLEAGASIKAMPGTGKHPNSEMIRLESCHNISFVGMPGSLISGLRAEIMDPSHHYLKSENRGGITVYDTSDLTMRGLTVELTGGDGLYLENVNNSLVTSSVFTRNYRQGMSVISAQNLRIEDCEFSETNGTAPMCECPWTTIPLAVHVPRLSLA
jgi:hypothetical protein